MREHFASSTKTLTALAVPDLFLAAPLTALDSGAARNLLGISGGSLLHVTPLVSVSNLCQSSASKN
jgi:hypothetical protein